MPKEWVFEALARLIEIKDIQRSQLLWMFDTKYQIVSEWRALKTNVRSKVNHLGTV
jgi:hypothetical protein